MKGGENILKLDIDSIHIVTVDIKKDPFKRILQIKNKC